MEFFRDELEEADVSLTSPSHMRQRLIPFVLQQECKTSDLKGADEEIYVYHSVMILLEMARHLLF